MCFLQIFKIEQYIHILIDLPYSDISLLNAKDIHNIKRLGVYEDMGVSDDCVIYIITLSKHLVTLNKTLYAHFSK